MSSNGYYKSKKFREKIKLNQDLQKKYPPFQIPSNLYEVVFINKYTSDKLLQTLINHVESCHEYTIDTEGEQDTGETVMVQIETIPKQLPKFVILLELIHLPTNNASKSLVKHLLHLIFRHGNMVYSWGVLANEFAKVKDQELFATIEAEPFNVQYHFHDWYDWARSSCESCRLFSANPCHPKNPYRRTEKWSLQRAIECTSELFLDKSITVNNWSNLLDSKHTSLSRSEHQRRVNYAVNDCLATSYLAKAVRNYWTFNDLKSKNFNELFISSSSPPSRTVNINNNNNIQVMIKNKPTKSNKVKQINGQLFGNVLNDGLQDISDDEIEEVYLHQLITPTDVEHKWGSVDVSRPEPGNISNIPREVSISTIINDTAEQIEPDQIINDTAEQIEPDEVINDVVLLIHDVQDINEDQQIELNEPTQREQKPADQRRSRPSKIRHNRKHARQQKKRRFRHLIFRKFFYRFKAFMIRKILRLYRIPYVHTMKEGDEVKIGFRNDYRRQQAEHDLANDIFSRRSYFYYKNKYKW